MDTPQEKETTTETVAGPDEATLETAPIIATAPVVTVPLYKKYSQFIAGLLGVLIVLIGYYVYTTQYPQDAIVAVVNGEKIYAQEFNESVALIEQTALAQGIDPSDPSVQEEIKKQALNLLIDNVLLIAAAKDAGFTVTDEKKDETYTQLMTELGGEEALKIRMEEIGLTDKKLRNNIEERLLTDQYIQSETDIETVAISDAEITAFIDALNVPEGELPPLEEIRPQIEEQLLGQKRQQLVTELLTKLRAEASIEIKI